MLNYNNDICTWNIRRGDNEIRDIKRITRPKNPKPTINMLQVLTVSNLISIVISVCMQCSTYTNIEIKTQKNKNEQKN